MGGADAVKVQLFDTYKMPGENRKKWEYLSMSHSTFTHLRDYAEKLNIDFFASAFDEERWGWIVDEGLDTNKIASSMLKLDIDLCMQMIKSGKATLISLGDWGGEYPFSPLDFPNVSYMHCVTEYPHSYYRARVMMPDEFNMIMCGYSDHSIGMSACKEAVMRGANIIEKHFTTDTNLQSDTEGAHSCSMTFKELNEFRIWCDLQC